MKRDNKNKKNKAGVSAVIGAILMVAITVAIALTVYVYVSDVINDNPTKAEIVTEQIELSSNYTIMRITFDDLWRISGYQKVEIIIMDFKNGSLITVKGFLYNTDTKELGYNNSSEFIKLKNEVIK